MRISALKSGSNGPDKGHNQPIRDSTDFLGGSTLQTSPGLQQMELLMRMLAALITLPFLLQGCAVPITAQSYGTIERTERTITVPIGSQGIVGKLKQALLSESWKLVVYNGPDITEGKITDAVKLETYQSFTTRYRLLATSRQYDTCLLPGPVSPLIRYDISIVDNKTGSEVFTLGGAGCESKVVEAFQSALKVHTK